MVAIKAFALFTSIIVMLIPDNRSPSFSAISTLRSVVIEIIYLREIIRFLSVS